MEKLIEEFLSYLQREKRVVPNTILSYRTDLRQFYRLLSFKNKGLKNLLEKETIEGLINWLKDNSYSPASKTRKISSLRSFLGWLIREGKINGKINPTILRYTFASQEMRKVSPLRS